MQFTLQDHEVDLLRNILERHLGDFRMEIGKTEDFNMRTSMKEDEEALKSILNQLQVTAESRSF